MPAAAVLGFILHGVAKIDVDHNAFIISMVHMLLLLLSLLLVVVVMMRMPLVF